MLATSQIGADCRRVKRSTGRDALTPLSPNSTHLRRYSTIRLVQLLLLHDTSLLAPNMHPDRSLFTSRVQQQLPQCLRYLQGLLRPELHACQPCVHEPEKMGEIDFHQSWLAPTFDPNAAKVRKLDRTTPNLRHNFKAHRGLFRYATSHIVFLGRYEKWT